MLIRSEVGSDLSVRFLRARYRNTRGEAYVILYEGVCSVNV